jgi:hypothetical protein
MTIDINVVTVMIVIKEEEIERDDPTGHLKLPRK